MKPPARRTFSIPAVATLTLFAATAACSDKDSDEDDEDDGGGGGSIVGTWGLDLVSYAGGYSYDFPYSYSGDGYSYTAGIQMRIDSSDSGEWCSYYNVEYNGENYDYEECYNSVAISQSGATYQIQVDMGLIMDCELGTASLSCTGEDEDGGTYDAIDWFRVD